jgi:hypothetical protein
MAVTSGETIEINGRSTRAPGRFEGSGLSGFFSEKK